MLKISYDRYSVLEKGNFATVLQLKVGRNKCLMSNSVYVTILPFEPLTQILSFLRLVTKREANGERA